MPRLPAVLVAFLLLVAGAAALGVGAIAGAYWSADKLPPVQVELLRGLVQFLAVGIAGSMVAMLFRWIEKERDDKRAKAEAREAREEKDVQTVRDVCLDILATYNRIKLIRRTMRASLDNSAATTRGVFLVDEKTYTDLFLKLEGEQIDLERLKKKIELNLALFDKVGGGGAIYRSNLRKAEKYLRDILREFETGDHKARDGKRVLGASTRAMGFFASSIDRKANPTLKGKERGFFGPMNALEDASVKQLSAVGD